MGIFRLYAELATHLKAQPELLSAQSLDKLAAVYSPYAYIGNRNSLEEAVLRNAEQLRTCRNAPAGDAESLAAWWFGRRDWHTDSGAFPDFVLASEGTGAVGDGALLELKDSRTEAIASFNSTLPSARKSLSRLTAIVADTVRRYEACFRGEGTDERDCFYLVRTHKQDPRACRLSLVQGTFFETLPTPQLLAELWGQLLAQANVPEELQKQVIEYLSQLDRADIAQTRQVERASVKPRLRIMSEIHREGNPHAYPEVPPRSITTLLATYLRFLAFGSE